MATRCAIAFDVLLIRFRDVEAAALNWMKTTNVSGPSQVVGSGALPRAHLLQPGVAWSWPRILIGWGRSPRRNGPGKRLLSPEAAGAPRKFGPEGIFRRLGGAALVAQLLQLAGRLRLRGCRRNLLRRCEDDSC